MNNFVKQILTRLFKECKLCLVTSGITLIITAILSKLRLGRVLPFKARGYDWTDMARLYRSDILDCFDVFNWHSETILSNAVGGRGHSIFHIYGVRVAAWISEDERLKVVIRGSDNLDNWVANLNTTTTRTTINGISVNVHAAYNEIAEGISNELKARYGATRREVALTGGSLGGALAILAAAHISNVFDIQQVISVGGPKVGATSFGFKVINIRHEQDPVPYLPLWNAVQGWDHDGTTFLIKKDGTARWYKNSLSTDISLSLLYLEEELDPSAHLAYREFVQ